MYETAKQLIDTTIKAHMQMFEIDRPARRPGIGFEAHQMWCGFPRDLNPDPDARSKSRQQIFFRRAVRFKTMYGN